MKTLIHFPASLNISKYSIPSTVESVGWAALKHMKYLKIIFLPETIQNYIAYAFNDAPSLEYIIVNRRFKQKHPIYGDYSFVNSNVKENDIIYIYPVMPPPTCITRSYSLYQSLLLYVFILID